MASELESELESESETLDWCRKWLVNFNAGKTQLVLYDRSNKAGAIDMKMDGSVLEEKSSFNPLNTNPEKWSNTPKQIVGNLPTICLSAFDHFMNLALKGLR